jgi:hypothetical protein
MNMFSIGTLYNFACSYAVIPIRIFPILMPIVFHHYKILTEKNFFFHSSSGFDFSLPSSDGGGGWQSHIIAINNMQLVVYYEVPDGKREEVKPKFNNFVRNQMVF